VWITTCMTPRCSLDAALPVAVVENLQKYRYILENIDGVFRYFSWFVPNFALHINIIDRLRSLLAVYLFRRLVYFINEYLATPWRVAVKYCHFLGSHVTGPDQGFLVSRLVLIRKPWERGCSWNCPLRKLKCKQY
jgi:hypothetical protein